jgi:transcriptional regulator with XRE-family HTH domain
MTTSAGDNGFHTLCREWRRVRKLSQLDLALAADVSQRHVSWLETGRSHPSRDMVLRLSEAMEIPLRERNVFLQSAGFSAAYSESSLEDPAMAPVLDALQHVLEHHDPLPAFVVDRHWNIRMQNKAAGLLLAVAGDPEQLMAELGQQDGVNLALLTLHPRGLRQYISNWDKAAPSFIRRLRHEAAASADPALQARMGEIIATADIDLDAVGVVGGLLPVLPLEVDLHGTALSLFSVISTFGTPQDITTDELRVEAFYPSDSATRQFFHDIANAH